MGQPEQEFLVGILSLLSGPVISPLVYLWNAKTKSKQLNSSIRLFVPVLFVVSYLGFLFAWNILILFQGASSLVLFLVPLVYLMGNEATDNLVNWRRMYVAISLVTMLVWLAGLYLMTPGYVMPLLNHPVSRNIIMATAIWQFVSSVLFCLPWKVERLSVNYFLIFCFQMLVVSPLAILFVLGPALFTMTYSITPLSQ